MNPFLIKFQVCDGYLVVAKMCINNGTKSGFDFVRKRLLTFG